MNNIFITATDTDAGKTFVACALTKALVNLSNKVAVYKPISAGCQRVDNVLINEDAKLLSEFANCQQSISDINPIAFLEPIAPHIAASKVGKSITVADINLGYEKVQNCNADITITEGAGGWRLPLNTKSDEKVFLSDFVKHQQQKVILVVNMKLGCLNHALLTYETIKADGLDCIAWIANTASISTMSNLDENISSLEHLLPIPKIAQFDFYQDDAMSLHDKIHHAADQIDTSFLR